MPWSVPRVSPDDAEEGVGEGYGDTPREGPETWEEEVPRDVRGVVMEGAWMPCVAREEGAWMPCVVREEGAFREHLWVVAPCASFPEWRMEGEVRRDDPCCRCGGVANLEEAVLLDYCRVLLVLRWNGEEEDPLPAAVDRDVNIPMNGADEQRDGNPRKDENFPDDVIDCRAAAVDDAAPTGLNFHWIHGGGGMIPGVTKILEEDLRNLGDLGGGPIESDWAVVVHVRDGRGGEEGVVSRMGILGEAAVPERNGEGNRHILAEDHDHTHEEEAGHVDHTPAGDIHSYRPHHHHPLPAACHSHSVHEKYRVVAVLLH